jgi:hypothetical protein
MTASTVREVTPSRRGLPAGLSEAEWQTAVEHAAALWSYPHISCSSLELRVAKAAHLRTTAQDGTNVVVFRSEKWCHNEECGPARAFPMATTGMTTTYPEGSRGIAVIEADIELNAVRFAFQAGNLVSSTSGASFPLETVLVHELGHAIGLEDTCSAGHGRGAAGAAGADPALQSRAEPNVDSAMCATALLAAPTKNDEQEVCQLYPRASDAKRPGDNGGSSKLACSMLVHPPLRPDVEEGSHWSLATTLVLVVILIRRSAPRVCGVFGVERPAR